jgi:hypothetical protein
MGTRREPVALTISKVTLLPGRLALLNQICDGQRPACGHRRVVIKMNSYSATRLQHQKTR